MKHSCTLAFSLESHFRIVAPLLDDVEVRNFLVVAADRSRVIVQLVDRRFEPIPKIVGRLDIAERRADAVVFDAIDRGDRRRPARTNRP